MKWDVFIVLSKFFFLFPSLSTFFHCSKMVQDIIFSFSVLVSGLKGDKLKKIYISETVRCRKLILGRNIG